MRSIVRSEKYGFRVTLWDDAIPELDKIIGQMRTVGHLLPYVVSTDVERFDIVSGSNETDVRFTVDGHIIYAKCAANYIRTWLDLNKISHR